MSVKLAANAPNSLVIRHDVDGIIWTPVEPPNNHCWKHEGTLLAFGYVQVDILAYCIIGIIERTFLIPGLETTKKIYFLFTGFSVFRNL